MKKVLVSIIALITINHCYSQAYMTFGTKALSTNPVYFNMGGGYVFNGHLTLDLEGKVPISQQINLATHLSGSIGYRIPINNEPEVSVTPMMGEALSYRSTDKKAMNTWTPTGAIRLTYKILYVQPAYIEKQLFVGIGFIAKLNRRHPAY